MGLYSKGYLELFRWIFGLEVFLGVMNRVTGFQSPLLPKAQVTGILKVRPT